MRITTNFTLDEFIKSDTANKLNIDNRLPHNGEDLYIKNLVVNLLQPLRDKFGVMKVNSGFRCQKLNKAVGGVSTSQHLKGKAADISFKETSLNTVWEYLKSNPDKLKWRQCILYKTFIHFNYDECNNKMQLLIKP